MSENPVLPVDKKTWNKWSFYINVVIFFIIAVFIWLLILDAFSAGIVYTQNDATLLTNAWIAVVRDIAFLAVCLVILFVQMFNYYRQLSRRSW
jgi:membrane-anchored glycerophosphoryl diester phosphodiesterase (GDPDase)